jgi:hypothetical protein
MSDCSISCWMYTNNKLYLRRLRSIWSNLGIRAGVILLRKFKSNALRPSTSSAPSFASAIGSPFSSRISHRLGHWTRQSARILRGDGARRLHDVSGPSRAPGLRLGRIDDGWRHAGHVVPRASAREALKRVGRRVAWLYSHHGCRQRIRPRADGRDSCQSACRVVGLRIDGCTLQALRSFLVKSREHEQGFSIRSVR